MNLRPVENLMTRVGMTQGWGKTGRHDNAADGSTMWLAKGENFALIFDFGAVYPVGEIWIWNYNQADLAGYHCCRRGVRQAGLDASLDGQHWCGLTSVSAPVELACADGQDAMVATNLNDGRHTPIYAGDVSARFVRFTVPGGPGVGNWGGIDGKEPLYGLSAVQFYAGKGWAAEPAPEWDALFRRSDSWTGADGIYSIPLTSQRALLIFGDTFIGPVDPASGRRFEMTMINNSVAYLDHETSVPSKVSIYWGSDSPAASAVVPKTPHEPIRRGQLLLVTSRRENSRRILLPAHDCWPQPRRPRAISIRHSRCDHGEGADSQ
ncbi:MAG: hypothetical protein OWU33_15975 [Firmicutes bacterium]|nr:hypothetical protein [Bacillota bacterium]